MFHSIQPHQIQVLATIAHHMIQPSSRWKSLVEISLSHNIHWKWMREPHIWLRLCKHVSCLQFCLLFPQFIKDGKMTFWFLSTKETHYVKSAVGALYCMGPLWHTALWVTFSRHRISGSSKGTSFLLSPGLWPICGSLSRKCLIWWVVKYEDELCLRGPAFWPFCASLLRPVLSSKRRAKTHLWTLSNL